MRLLPIALAAALAAVPGTALAMSHTPSPTPGGSDTPSPSTPAPSTPAPSAGGADSPTSVPEPATMALLGGGIAALGIARKKRRKG